MKNLLLLIVVIEMLVVSADVPVIQPVIFSPNKNVICYLPSKIFALIVAVIIEVPIVVQIEIVECATPVP